MRRVRSRFHWHDRSSVMPWFGLWLELDRLSFAGLLVAPGCFRCSYDLIRLITLSLSCLGFDLILACFALSSFLRPFGELLMILGT